MRGSADGRDPGTIEARRLGDLMDLKLVTWNVHGLPWPLSQDKSYRLGGIAGVIRQVAPDFILLQEVWRPDDARDFVESFGDRYRSAGNAGNNFLLDPRVPLLGQILLPLSVAVPLRRGGLLTCV